MFAAKKRPADHNQARHDQDERDQFKNGDEDPKTDKFHGHRFLILLVGSCSALMYWHSSRLLWLVTLGDVSLPDLLGFLYKIVDLSPKACVCCRVEDIVKCSNGLQ
jgi:hypothetical protein